MRTGVVQRRWRQQKGGLQPNCNSENSVGETTTGATLTEDFKNLFMLLLVSEKAGFHTNERKIDVILSVGMSYGYCKTFNFKINKRTR